MIREWATVMCWKNGIATLHADIKTSCGGCAARATCGSHLLNKIGPKNAHVMKIAVKQPLVAGQRIELGLRESSLLGSAMLVYMTPVVGLFVLAALMQMVFHNDFAAAAGAFIGGIGGFTVAKWLALHLAKKEAFVPVILNISLPPEALCVKKNMMSEQK